MSCYRWNVIGFAFIAVLIAYLDRTALSYAVGPIEKLFHFSNREFGAILSAFGIGYLFMTVIGGVIVDIYGARKTWSLFAIIWGIVCILLGMATGFVWLFFAQILLGLAEGPSFPAFTRVATDWLPMSERVRALAVGLAAVPLASVIGAPLVSHLIAAVGWRIMFFVLGLMGLIWAIFWFLIFRDHPWQSKYVSSQELMHIEKESGKKGEDELVRVKHPTTWKFMLFNRSFLANNYAFFAFGYLLFFAINWLPAYLQQTFAFSVKKVGWYLIAPWLTATIFVLLGGIISDYLWRKTHSIRIARSHLIWICQLLSVICFIPVVLTNSLDVAMVGISLGVGFGMMPNAAFYAINADLAHDRAGTSLGIMTCASSAAAILAPFLTGLLSVMTGNFSAAILLVISFTLISALIIFIFQHPDEALEQKARPTA